MPSTSPSQRRLFGMVLAQKRGELKNPSSKVKKVAAHISDGDAKDFAKKRDGIAKSLMTGKSGY